MEAKTYTVLARFGILEPPEVHVHCGCYLMTALAVANRVGMEVPSPDPSYARAMYGSVHDLYCRYIGSTGRVPLGDIPLRYSGPKRKRYETALKSLELSPLLNAKDVQVKCFVKKERVWYDDKLFGRPRLIMPRSPRYNLLFMSYYLPIEDKLLSIHGPDFIGRTVAKGRTQEERYHDLWEKYTHTPWFCCFDLKAFEAHYNQLAYEFTDSVYLRAAGKSRMFTWLLKSRWDTKGVSSNGLRYTQRCKRASGDVDTGGGNTLVAMALVHSYLMLRGLPLNSYHDGDDGVVFFPRDPSFVPGLVEHCARCGFELEPEEPTGDFNRLNFCQSRPVGGDLKRMLRDPMKSLRSDATYLGTMRSVTQVYEWIKAIGVCYSYVYRGAPIGQEYARALLAQLPEDVPYRPELIPDLGYKYHVPAVVEDWSEEVTESTRLAFEESYSINSQLQMCVEGSFVGTKLDLWPGEQVTVLATPNVQNFRNSTLAFGVGTSGISLAGQ